MENKSEKAFKTILEMFEQRDYVFLENDDERIIACKDDGKLTCAFVPRITSKFNVDKYQLFTSMAKQMDLKHIIIVYKESITSQARKLIEVSNDIEIELFNEDELQYNLTKHAWVPEHSLYARKGSEEAQEFTKQKDVLPVILKTDAVARFYGYQKGDIVRVKRHNGLVIFRIVK